MNVLKGACIIGQSGGPTSVINASAYGVIRTALDSDVITKVYGAEHGIKGVLEDKLYDMAQEDPAELDLMKYTPSSALGTGVDDGGGAAGLADDTGSSQLIHVGCLLQKSCSGIGKLHISLLKIPK